MMTTNRRTFRAIACTVAILLTATAKAGDKDSALPVDLTQPAAAATIERICDQAVVNIGRRYNLNDIQQEETDRIMTKYVHSFLKEHEDEIWPAIRELLANNLKPPETDEELRRLGKAARKLAKLAHKAVKDGNAEWRKILTNEQKRTHDFDLAELDKTFAQMDQNFGEWSDGKRTKENESIFPKPQVAGGGPRPGPPTPIKPSDEWTPRGKAVPFELTVFDTFVEGFIKEYGLDTAQIVSARSILKETKAKAGNFRSTKKSEFARIEEARNKAIAARNRDEQKKLDAERKKLMEPVYGLFAGMESRLRDLLTTAQVERHQAKAKAFSPDAGRKIVKKDPSPKKKDQAKTEQAKKKAQGNKKSDALAADPRTTSKQR